MQNENDVLWEKYCYAKPLTFWEFVQEFKSLKSLFPCVKNALLAFGKRSKDFYDYPSEIYVQGAVGIGKSVYCYLVFLYRVYLFLLSKSKDKRRNNAASAVIVGPRAFETLKSVIHFIESAQPTIFCAEIASQTVDFWMERDRKGDYLFRSSCGNSLALMAAKTGKDLLGIRPVIGYLADCPESGSFELFSELRARLSAGNFKPLFPTLIVDKSPNNLYSDLLDQTIKAKEFTQNALVERFVPIFYRDCSSFNDRDGIDLPYKICLDTGEIEKRGWNDVIAANWSPFPALWDGRDLYNWASENPKAFVNEFLGKPILSPFTKEYKVTDSLSALQTIKKLVNDYHVQFSFDENGLSLSAPGTDIKIKVY